MIDAGQPLGEDTESLTLERPKTKRPKRYYVVLHNDDYTTQEFVVHVLMHYFFKTSHQATALMLKVHTEGKARVGLYPKDVAETKVQQVLNHARSEGMPLMVTAESE